MVLEQSSDAAGASILVKSTGDGGQHWRSANFTSSVQTASAIVGIEFAGSRNGWIYALDSGMFEDIEVLLVTEDGGATWSEPADGACVKSPVSVLLGSQGDDVFWGSDPHAGGAPAQDATLFWSKADACNWSTVRIPVPKMYRYSVPTGIQFFNKRDGVLATTLTAERSGTSPAMVLFRTTDGGITWTPSPPLVVPDAIWDRPVFSDPDHGWLVGRRSNLVLLYRTTDAGESWSSTGVSELAGVAGATVSIIDSETGWLATWQDGPKQLSRLWKTTDGGLTWTPLVYSLQP